MICINIFGAQGSGKSTTAAYIFYRLKSMGYSCELVTEVAKDLVWDCNRVGIETQMYVSGTQFYRLNRLSGKVDIAITDAPLLLQAVYYDINDCPNVEEFQNIEYASFMKYENINFVLPLPEGFDENGRVGYDNSNAEIHNKMMELLIKYNVPFTILSDLEDDTLKNMVDLIIDQINSKGDIE